MSHHHHSHHHDEHDHCCCCHENACSASHHHDEHHDDFSQELLNMADQAWMEVLKDKIKAQIIESNGDRLDHLAKIVSDSNNVRWMHKLGSKKEVRNFRDKIHAFFSRE